MYSEKSQINEDIDAAGDSLESELIVAMDEASSDRKCAEQMKQVRDILTKTQFRRLWLHYAEGKTHQEIADMEGVGRRRVTTSIDDAQKKINKFLKTG